MNITNTKMKYLYFLTILLLSPFSHDPMPKKVVKGITMVAPPKELSDKPIEQLRTVNAEWVALVPYGFSRDGQPEVRFFAKQWWGETPEGIRKCTRIAHEKGLKVMIKPQVYIHNGWIGDMEFKKEKDWQEWEESYRNYILTFARIAAEEKAEMFCIGTEYKIAAQKRENFWRTLIKEVRSFYDGNIIYSSNWDGYQKVPFWDELDYIGISAYFPLTDMETPSLSKLKKEWKPIVNALKRFSKKKNKRSFSQSMDIFQSINVLTRPGYWKRKSMI